MRYKIYMSETEIKTSMVYARNKQKQLKILSELNLVSPGIILMILRDTGFDISDLGGGSKLRKANDEFNKQIVDMVNNGVKASDIAMSLGFSYSYISSKIRKLKKMGMLPSDNTAELAVENTKGNEDVNIEVDNNNKLKYIEAYTRIEALLDLRYDNDSDEIKEAFSDLAIKILRENIRET